MNTENCTNGFASDQAFQNIEIGVCNVNLIGFFLASYLVIFLRLFACIAKFRKSYITSQSLKLGNGSYRQKELGSRLRHYLSLSSSTFSVISYLIIANLVGFNYANIHNGISFSLYSIVYLPFMVDFNMLLFRVVRTGQKVIKLPSASESAFGDTKYLSKFSKIGLFLVIIQSFAAIVSCLVLIVLTPIFPEDTVLLAIIGFYNKAAFQFLCAISVCHQYERCVLLLKSIRSRLIRDNNEEVARYEDDRSKLNAAIFRLRNNQFYVILFFGGHSILLFLLAGNFFPWSWEVILIGSAFPESLGNAYIEISHCRRRVNSKPSKQIKNNLKSSEEITVLEAEPRPHQRSKKKKSRKRWILDLSRVPEERSKYPYTEKEENLQSRPIGTLVENPSYSQTHPESPNF